MLVGLGYVMGHKLPRIGILSFDRRETFNLALQCSILKKPSIINYNKSPGCVSIFSLVLPRIGLILVGVIYLMLGNVYYEGNPSCVRKHGEPPVMGDYPLIERISIE